MANKYTKIDNYILDYLYSVNMSASELQILIFLIRYTNGFNRQTAKISYKYISNGTGLSVSTVKRTILKFIKNGVVSELYSPCGKSERIVKLEWSNLIRTRINPDTLSYQNRYHYRISSDHQEIKEEIKDKEIKEEERAFAPNSSGKEVSQEEYDPDWWDRFVKGEEDFDEE